MFLHFTSRRNILRGIYTDAILDEKAEESWCQEADGILNSNYERTHQHWIKHRRSTLSELEKFLVLPGRK